MILNKTLAAPLTHSVVTGPAARPTQGTPTKETPGKLLDRTLGYRYELKYLITDAETEAITQYCRPYLELDRYSKLQPNGYYPIVSLYLDSPDMILCRETLTGKKNRFKLRIRSYSDDEQYPVFFEIKRRVNTVIVKSRAAARRQDIKPLLAGLSLPKQDFRTNMEALSQFQLYVMSIHAGPAVLIRYMRKAFEAPTENRVRVTFDRQLCYKVTREPIVSLNGPCWQHNPVTMRRVILEIKFTSRYPVWLSRLVRQLNLDRQSVSKYATSIQQSCALGFCGPIRG